MQIVLLWVLQGCGLQECTSYLVYVYLPMIVLVRLPGGCLIRGVKQWVGVWSDAMNTPDDVLLNKALFDLGDSMPDR